MFAIPSLTDLVERTRSAFRANLPGSDAWLFPNNINPTAKVIAGSLHLAFGFLDYIQRQKFALTADGENLDLHGEELGMSRRPASPAYGKVKVTAAGALNIVPGAVFRRSDAAEYRSLDSAVLVAPGNVTINVVATLDGVNGNALSGTALEIVSGVTGEALAEIATDAVAGGTDIEDDESFRARILFRKRNPPHGGAPADYVMWAMQLPGVTRVFVERLWTGAGSVRVFPFMDDHYPNGIPPSSWIGRIRDHIDMLRPAGAIVTVAAATPVPVDVEIVGIAPDTTAVREAVLAELRGAFRRLGVVAGSDTPHAAMPYLAAAASFSRSWLWQAVANATGEERHEIAEPDADVELSAGQIAVLGDVTFTAPE